MCDAARAIFDAGPAHVVLRDLEGYLRGRAAGEVPALFQAELARLGLAGDTVEVAPSEALALRRALSLSKPRDLVVISLLVAVGPNTVHFMRRWYTRPLVAPPPHRTQTRLKPPVPLARPH